MLGFQLFMCTGTSNYPIPPCVPFNKCFACWVYDESLMLVTKSQCLAGIRDERNSTYANNDTSKQENMNVV